MPIILAPLQERVVRPRIRSIPRPPEQPPSREPVVLEAGDLTPNYLALALAMVAQAELDCRHQCSRGCLSKDDCHRRRLSARRFLAALRTGRSETIWSDWIALAEARVRP